ncbi:MAG: tryptophan--tRNA ligase [Anaerolineaceae bacterium]
MSNNIDYSTGNETDSLKECIARSPILWDELEKQPAKFRVLTGERTTGALHIGHYFGSLKSRVTLQNWGVEMFLVLADYQAITDRVSTEKLKESIFEIILDYLAVGIQPDKTTIFCHSMIPALNQLMLPFLSVVTMSELQRNPTVKEEIALSGTKSVSGLMMTYPVHQAADILYCKGNIVPGGKDQLPHVEITRLIARRINNMYFKGENFFPEPELLLSAPMLLGIDGRKMGKSLHNAIYLKMTADETAQLIKQAKTDSEMNISYDPNNRPEIANLLRLYSLCTGIPPEVIAGQIGNKGASALKKNLTEAVNEYFYPIRERRNKYKNDPVFIWNILKNGNTEANEIANKTLNELSKAMHMQYY